MGILILASVQKSTNATNTTLENSIDHFLELDEGHNRERPVQKRSKTTKAYSDKFFSYKINATFILLSKVY